MKTVTALVVEDSAVARELLVDTLNSDPRISVVAAVENGEAALRAVKHLAPDIVAMDVRLPGMSGIEATRRIMAECPTPVIVVASDMSRASTASAMEALRAGALLVVEKPAVGSAEAYRAIAKRLCDQFVGLSLLKLVRQRFNAATPPLRKGAVQVSASVPREPVEVVGIVASTGGPPAIVQILEGISEAFPVPILVVQHMGAGFLAGFADWLGSATGRDVRLVRDGEVAEGGCVYVAPGGHHLGYDGGILRLTAATGDSGHVPSGDVLFLSLAASASDRALGVLLTGMGNDGAAGLLALRRAGAVTIAQDRATSAVYGMPAAAKAVLAVCEELPVTAIAPRLLSLVSPVTKIRSRVAR